MIRETKLHKESYPYRKRATLSGMIISAPLAPSVILILKRKERPKNCLPKSRLDSEEQILNCRIMFENHLQHQRELFTTLLTLRKLSTACGMMAHGIL
ncbi:hypothetical protein DPMN_083569 [Dreissena polymorpha]|uniref:Uncharacterized protein n=1 Tax=Dreissena polymorpha TaxID=45954 RepID=A0A9D3YBH5_DREPO|nr:hypothetical protein DPMN_083569 [Dreissena polymorpha]